MNNNDNNIPQELKQKLDSFDVKIPDFSHRKRKIDRLANWIYAPAKNPLDILPIKTNSLLRVILYPLLFVLALSCGPLFFI